MKELKRLWKPLVFASGCALLLCTVSSANASSTSTSTSNTQNVVVTNTSANPVPVTGAVASAQSGSWTVGVNNTFADPVPIIAAGSVASAQSGTWTVGINGTPSFVVANTSANPLPIAGTVSAAQSGDWAVSLKGTPAVALSGSPTVQVSTTTDLILDGEIQGIPPQLFDSTGPMDVSAYKQIRIAVEASVTPFLVDIYTITSRGTKLLLEQVASGNSTQFTRVYDTPGRTIEIFVRNQSTSSQLDATIDIWGRSN
jgi:hypothetical protein